MLDDFMMRAALASLGVALAAAPLGCFVVWRRMAYFGDATAHAAMLGVAMALFLSLPIFPAVLGVCWIMAALVTMLSGRGFAMDTLLGVMAHSALAIGLVSVSFVSGVRIDLMAYLFGDILAVNTQDLLLIWTGGLSVVGLLSWRWPGLLLSTLNPDLAVAGGYSPRREQIILTLCLATVVAVAIKVVGVLLIVALLIIPAATARPFSRSPEGMACLTAAIGALASLGGLQAAFLFDTPTSPTIVCLAALLFLFTNLLRFGLHHSHSGRSPQT